MHKLELSIMLATLGQLAAAILVIFEGIPLYFLDNFSFCSNVYINFHEYVNETTGTYYR